MRALDEHGGTGPRRRARWRARALIPALLAAVGGGSLSCFGDCPPTTAPPPRQAEAPLRPRYVLVRAGNLAPPAVLAEGPGVRIRLLADTLHFTLGADSTRGTYTETVVLGVLEASGGETISRTVSPSRAWTRPANGPLTLAAFSGGGPVVVANGSPFEFTGPGGTPPQLNLVAVDGRVFSFEAR